MIVNGLVSVSCFLNRAEKRSFCHFLLVPCCCVNSLYYTETSNIEDFSIESRPLLKYIFYSFVHINVFKKHAKSYQNRELIGMFVSYLHFASECNNCHRMHMAHDRVPY